MGPSLLPSFPELLERVWWLFEVSEKVQGVPAVAEMSNP